MRDKRTPKDVCGEANHVVTPNSLPWFQIRLHQILCCVPISITPNSVTPNSVGHNFFYSYKSNGIDRELYNHVNGNPRFAPRDKSSLLIVMLLSLSTRTLYNF